MSVFPEVDLTCRKDGHTEDTRTHGHAEDMDTPKARLDTIRKSDERDVNVDLWTCLFVYRSTVNIYKHK